MKQVLLFTASLLIASSVSAQTTTTTVKKTTTTTTKTTRTAAHGSAVGGYIHDARMHPLAGVQAFIYANDSAGSIIASGYTDAMGFYETNGVAPGRYNLKIVYPSTKAVVVKGVPVKGGVTQVILHANPPEADTTLLYTDMVPKVDKKADKKKA
jgi:hypothetical protein